MCSKCHPIIAIVGSHFYQWEIIFQWDPGILSIPFCNIYVGGMSIYSVECSVQDEKLALQWLLFGPAHAVSICVANNREFTENMRHFVLPPVTSALLDIGGGAWYVRFGAWTGTLTHGIIDWALTCGPIVITANSIVPTIPFTLPIIHRQPIRSAMRIYTGILTPYYVLFESAETHMFSAQSTTHRYVLDNGRGFVDCTGLEYNSSYIIRISRFGPDSSQFPTDTIQQVDTGRVLYGMRSARPLRYINTASENAIVYDELRGASLPP